MPAALGHVGDAEAGARGGEIDAMSLAREDARRPRHRPDEPEMARSVVVLPAPLAPSSATTSPGATVRSRSRTTAAPS